MMFPCLAAALCLEGDMSALKKSGLDCHEIAVKSNEVSTTARDKADVAIANTNDIKNLLASFGTRIDLNTFRKIQDLVQQKKARETIQICTEMDDLALQLASQAGEMMTCLQTGIDNGLPQSIRDELQEEDNQQEQTRTTGSRAAGAAAAGDGNDDNDDDADADATALTALLNVDTDLDDMATNTRGIEKVNIFTAAQNGTNFYRGVEEKEMTCRDIFEKISSVGTSIARIAKAFSASAGASCCEQLQAIGAGVKELFKCLRLAKLVQAAAAAVGRLIQAISQFLTSSWQNFQGFLAEFDAAKRMGRLFQNVNPVKILNDKIPNGSIVADATAAIGQSLFGNSKIGQSLFGNKSSAGTSRDNIEDRQQACS
jgi:hypothetical protein